MKFIADLHWSFPGKKNSGKSAQPHRQIPYLHMKSENIQEVDIKLKLFF